MSRSFSWAAPLSDLPEGAHGGVTTLYLYRPEILASLIEVAGAESTESIMLAVECIGPEMSMLFPLSSHWPALLQHLTIVQGGRSIALSLDWKEGKIGYG